MFYAFGTEPHALLKVSGCLFRPASDLVALARGILARGRSGLGWKPADHLTPALGPRDPRSFEHTGGFALWMCAGTLENERTYAPRHYLKNRGQAAYCRAGRGGAGRGGAGQGSA